MSASLRRHEFAVARPGVQPRRLHHRIATRRRRLFFEPLEERSLLAAVITVNSTLDTNVRDSALTLREAILINNRTLAVGSLTATEQAQVVGTPTSGDRDTIGFNIPGSGVRTISPISALPIVTDSVIIDGYTQPGSRENTNPAGVGLGLNTVIMVEIDGSLTGSGAVDGIIVNANDSTIRGLAIGNFGGHGIFLLDARSGNRVEGSFLGTDASGTVRRPNDNGIVHSNAVIGGTTPAARNLISGSDRNGLGITGPGAVVQGNLIGTDISGTRPIGNGGTFDGGIVVLSFGAPPTASPSILIGGNTSEAANVIAFNGSFGVGIALTSKVAVQGNAIFGNTGLGIDLNVDGVTANDSGDADSGPNRLQNFPVIGSAMSSGTTLSVQYSVLSTTANSAYPLRVEFYKADSAGQEGQVFIGADTYLGVEASATKTTAITTPFAFLASDKLVAIATDSNGNTSEFSPSIAIQTDVSCLSVTNTLDSGPGSLRAAITCANTNGVDDVIIVPAGEYTLSGSANEDNNVSGDLDLDEANHSLTIRGAGASQTIINAGGNDRGVHVLQNVTAVLESLSVIGGSVGSGGGIINAGKLTLNDVTVRNNAATTGGGIHNTGELTLNRTSVRNNSATSTSSTPRGGGISASVSTTPSPFISIVDSTIEDNTVTMSGTSTAGITAQGGAVSSNSVPISVVRSIIRDNSVSNIASAASGGAFGGGIHIASATASITSSEIRNNQLSVSTAGSASALTDGGGIYSSGGPLTIDQCLIVENAILNSSTTTGVINVLGGGLFFSASTNTTKLTIRDSDLSRNTIEATTTAGSTNVSNGGGVYAAGGTIEIARTTIQENRVTGLRNGSGGGVNLIAATGENNAATATFTNVVISQNIVEAPTSASGGGLTVSTNVSATLSNSTIDGNRINGPGFGGALSVTGNEMTVIGSTISRNSIVSATSGNGGGIRTTSPLTLIESTVSGNTVTGASGFTSSDGGISTANDPILIRNSTITGNRVVNGTTGGLDAAPVNGVTFVTMHNSIVAGNFAGSAGTTPSDIGGTINVGTGQSPSSFNNLVGNSATSGGLVNGVNGNKVGNNGSGTIDINTVLNTTLANNGGPTMTHALVAGSPAINAGSNAQAVDAQNQPLTTDQRGAGFPRINNSVVDIGSFEAVQQACSLVVTNTLDSGPGSLREAITCANNTPNVDGPDAGSEPDADVITFAIPGTGLKTITPLSALPAITEAVVIDGYTQSGASANTLAVGNNAVLMVELNGMSAGAGANGLTIGGSGSTVRGLVINRFAANGILLEGGGSHTVAGNFIGTNSSGSGALGNGATGVRVLNSVNNTIGGSAASARNVISGNLDSGVYVTGALSSGNTIAGNYVGVSAGGATALGNSPDGVVVETPSNAIGGAQAGEGNLISGNSRAGVVLFSGAVDNMVAGNLIGVNAAGTAAVGNQAEGIGIHGGAESNQIGVWAANVISGNAVDGIVLFGSATRNVIEGNFIGTNLGGTAAIPNGSHGIRVAGATNNSIRNGNTIAHNGGAGVAVLVDTAAGNSIVGNSIFGNAGLGIDLAGDGVTSNDLSDADVGPNGLQNFPVITGVTRSGGNTQISGRLESTPNTLFRLEFFTSDLDPSGQGQGQTFLGAIDVTTTANGSVFFTTPGFAGVVPAGRVVTATATTRIDDDGSPSTPLVLADTSEFSAAACSLIVTTTADSGLGSLREAIRCANILSNIDRDGLSGVDPDPITFAIPGSGVQAITLASSLPEIAEAVTIDGYSQPGARANTLAIGNDAVLLVEINAAAAAAGTGVLHITGGSSTVRGLVINRSPGAAIVVPPATGASNRFDGNFLGTNAAGNQALPNGGGVFVATPRNVIGGELPRERNVIVTTGDAVRISSGQVAALGTVVQGNYLGTNAMGTAALPAGSRGAHGVLIAGAVDNAIGGPSTGARNVIANFDLGVSIFGSQASINTVQGNYIGTDAAGVAALGNGVGIQISQPAGQAHNSGNLIGGVGAGNLVSGNGAGIVVHSDFNTVQGNLIGVDFGGVSPLPNGGAGISIDRDAVRNLVGGTFDGEANIIANNGAGIVVASGTGNSFLRNSIYASAGLGIDLVSTVAGVTPNDAGDGDSGPNQLQNFPEITRAVIGDFGAIEMTYFVPTAEANATYPLRVEFFKADAGGEGQILLGFDIFTAEDFAAGPKTIIFLPISGVELGDSLVATATDSTLFGSPNNTSEFSPSITVQLPIPPQVDLSVTKSDGVTNAVPGNRVTYTIVVNNAGPAEANGATLSDVFPDALTNVTYVSVAAGGASGNTLRGSGNIFDNLSLPAGASVTYTVTGMVNPTATGSLSNTASVTTPDGITDTNPANNSTTDTDALTPQADLSITKTDGVTSVDAGATLTYTIVVRNAGPSAVTGATVTDLFPAVFLSPVFTATGSGGASGFSSGSGNIQQSVSLPVNGSIMYVVTGTVSAGASGTLSNTASVGAPVGVSDPNLANGSAVDADNIISTAPNVGLVIGADAHSRGKPVVSVYDDQGVRTAKFLAYANSFRGGVRVALGDVTGDGVPEIITSPGANHAPVIKVFTLEGVELPEFRFLAYAGNFKGGVYVAVGDVTGDPLNDIVVSPSKEGRAVKGPASGGTEVRVYENRMATSPGDPFFDNAPDQRFSAFPRGVVGVNFLGGGTVATGDVQPGGKLEVIVGSGPGMRARARAFNVDSGVVAVQSWLPFDRNVRGGIFVSAGRIDGDAAADVVFGAWQGSDGLVEIRSSATGALLRPLFRPYAGLPRRVGSSSGLRIVARDVDGDGTVDRIIAGQGSDGRTKRVIQFGPFDARATDFLFENDPDFIGGLHLG